MDAAGTAAPELSTMVPKMAPVLATCAHTMLFDEIKSRQTCKQKKRVGFVMTPSRRENFIRIRHWSQLDFQLFGNIRSIRFCGLEPRRRRKRLECAHKSRSRSPCSGVPSPEPLQPPNGSDTSTPAGHSALQLEPRAELPFRGLACFQSHAACSIRSAQSAAST